jgi:hypothetical protein
LAQSRFWRSAQSTYSNILAIGYDAIPTIGPLFLLKAIASGVVALGLVAPIERVLPTR